MGRVKTYCRGINQDGSSCSNRAVKGSYYCQRHQKQVTSKDVSDMQNANMIGGFVLVAIIVIAFLISFAAGCEDKFLKWMTK